MKKLAEVIAGLEKRLATPWSGMPDGWNEHSRHSFWDSLVGDVEHKRTKCYEKIKDHLPGEKGRKFCQSLWDDYENK